MTDALGEKSFLPYSETTIDSLKLAEEEARRLGHNYVGTEHLLLGAIHDGNVAHVLRSESLYPEKPSLLERFRNEVEFIIGRGDRPSMSEILLTPRAKRALVLTDQEAKRLEASVVEPYHILLGLCVEGEGIAAGVLESRGYSLSMLRARTLSLRESGFAPSETAPIEGSRQPIPEADTLVIRLIASLTDPGISKDLRYSRAIIMEQILNTDTFIVQRQ